jgi:tRNA dimethylallyltransferase
LGAPSGIRPTIRPAICPAIVGPTAVGKTALITSLARQLPVEVISLDSRQIYRGLRIGTAQPTAEELALCPHHLIDFLDPGKTYDAMRFRQDFERTYREVTSHGALPLLVGGAGMYLTGLRQGFMRIPGTSPDTVAAAREQLDPLDDQEIRERLQKVDPRSFAAIHPNDRYRSQRALEIHLIAGRPMSALKAEQRPDPCLGLEFPTFVLQREVDELDARIALRTGMMLQEGWIEETRQALAAYPADCPGLQSIGYREIVAHLQGNLEHENLCAEIVRVTRQYAKRQRTWFRQTPQVLAAHPEDPSLARAILDLVAG